MRKKKVLFFVTEDWYFWSHRIDLAKTALNAGYDVSLVTRVTDHGGRIRASGIKLIPIELERGGINPFSEFKLIRMIRKIIREENPDVMHNVALKPILSGGIAAWLEGVPLVISAVAGLGYMFTENELKARMLRSIVSPILGLLLNRKSSRVIMQNPDDMGLLVDSGALNPERAVIIKGAGVDTDYFKPEQKADGIPMVLLASRMLWNKGVGDFVKAAESLHRKGVEAKFILAGRCDPDNAKAIPRERMEKWNQEGAIRWIGHQEDIRALLHAADVVCLPSSREGMPKVLIEAASVGLPLVAYDVSGCRDIVRHNQNGLLVPFGRVDELESAIKILLSDPGLRKKMGKAGRELVVSEFSMEKINHETIALYGGEIR